MHTSDLHDPSMYKSNKRQVCIGHAEAQSKNTHSLVHSLPFSHLLVFRVSLWYRLVLVYLVLTYVPLTLDVGTPFYALEKISMQLAVKLLQDLDWQFSSQCRIHAYKLQTCSMLGDSQKEWQKLVMMWWWRCNCWETCWWRWWFFFQLLKSPWGAVSLWRNHLAAVTCNWPLWDYWFAGGAWDLQACSWWAHFCILDLERQIKLKLRLMFTPVGSQPSSKYPFWIWLGWWVCHSRVCCTQTWLHPACNRSKNLCSAQTQRFMALYSHSLYIHLPVWHSQGLLILHIQRCLMFARIETNTDSSWPGTEMQGTSLHHPVLL